MKWAMWAVVNKESYTEIQEGNFKLTAPLFVLHYLSYSLRMAKT